MSKNQGFYKNRIFPVFFMFLITAVFIFLISGLYYLTGDTIRKNAALFLKKAVLAAAGITVPGNEEELDLVYSRDIREIKNRENRILYWEVVDSSANVTGYVVLSRGPGLWGEIEAAIGVDSAFGSILGIEFTSQSETPGLGARISEAWFKNQFKGKSGPLKGVPEGAAAGPGEINTITGASITSASVLNIVNSLVLEGKKALNREAE